MSSAQFGEVSANWRRFFWAAAIYNFVIGLAGMLTPEATIDARIIGLLVFAFGVIYFLVARDPLRFAPVLWAGVLGKSEWWLFSGLKPSGQEAIRSLPACSSAMRCSHSVSWRSSLPAKTRRRADRRRGPGAPE